MKLSQVKKLDHDAAVEALDKFKADLAEKRDEFYAFLKENKLKRTADHSDNKSFGKAFKKFKAEIDSMTEIRDALKERVKETKPKKSSGRKSKYEYPEDVVTKEQKKKHRTKMRAEEKKAEKVADKAKGGEKASKKKASKKKEEAPAKASKKKASKKKASEEDED